MIENRTRGTVKLCIVCQCVIVSLAFWFWLQATQLASRSDWLNIRLYAAYNLILVAGLILAYATASQKAWFSQLAFSAAHNKALRQTLFAATLLLLLLTGRQDKAISRLFLFTFFPLLYFLLVVTQWALPAVLQRVSFGGLRRQRVLVAGQWRNASHIQTYLRSKERLGYFIAGLVSHDGKPKSDIGLKYMGTPEELEQVIVEHDITQVMLVEFPELKNYVSHYTRVCELHGVRLLIMCDFERTLQHPVTMFEDEGMRFLGLRDEPLEEPLGRFGKRCLDIAGALPVVIFVLPVMTIIVAFLQRRYAPGPIFFRQLRNGLQNTPFAMYKFRTMQVYNDDPARQASKGDSRIYPGGDMLRRLSLDELPQFINVLFGDMSIVGPRPHLMEHDKLFAQALANYPVRASVKPGITGLAQVRGFRGETKTEQDVIRRVESDIYYLENWSLLMDCWIIARTAYQVVRPVSTAF